MSFLLRSGLLLFAFSGLFAQVDVDLDRDYLPEVDLNQIISTGSQYFAVGQNGLILSSSDAVHWDPLSHIEISDFVFDELKSIAWNGSLLLAAGDLGRVFTSSDGLVWNESFTPSYGVIESIIWEGTTFIAVGEQIGTSQNGTDWVEQKVASPLSDVACKDGLCIAVGQGGTFLISSDLQTWAPQTPFTTDDLVAIDTLGIKFIAISDDHVFTSDDGTSWTPVFTLSSKAEALNIDNGLAVILQEDGKLTSSTDGVQWISGETGLPDGVTSLIWDCERYVGVGKSGSLVYGQSLDAWSAILRDETLPSFAEAKKGEVFITPSPQGLWSSGCARSWRRQPNPVPALIRGVDLLGNNFIAVGNNGTIITSSNGYDWTTIPFLNNTETLYTVRVGATSILVSGSGAKVYGRSLASNDWQEITVSNLGVFGIEWDGQWFMTLGGLASSYKSMDGFNWETFISGGAVIDNANFLEGGVNHATYFSYFESFNQVGYGIVTNGSNSSSGVLPPYVWGWRWLQEDYLAVGFQAYLVHPSGGKTELHHPWGIWLKQPLVSQGRAYIPFGNSNFKYVFDGQACECPIYREPENTVACIGSKAELTIYAEGDASYQWRKEGAPIPGATEATLSIPSFQAADAGSYDCIVQTPCITVTSARVILEPGPGVKVQEEGPPTSIFADPLLSASFKCDPGGLSWYWRDITNNLEFGFNQTTVRVPPAASPRYVEIVVNVPGKLGTVRGRFQVFPTDPIWIDLNGDGCQDVDDWLFALPLWLQPFPANDDPNRDGNFDIRDFLYIPSNGDGCK